MYGAGQEKCLCSILRTAKITKGTRKVAVNDSSERALSLKKGGPPWKSQNPMDWN